jgi:multicomponent Na+:H+ antiporter subunit E
MKAAALLNLLIAVLWLFLADVPSLERFILGWLTGFALIAVFADLLKARRYVRLVWGLVNLFFVLVREVTMSSLSVLLLAWSDRASRPKSAFFTYDAKHLSTTETMLLAHFITLTPGTVTVDFLGEDLHTLRIHILDSEDVERSKKSIGETLERAILQVTRV